MFLDFMLKNVIFLYTSIIFILIGSYVLFSHINKINFFYFAVFITIKFTTASYIDHYIRKKRELNEFEETNYLGVKILLSLIITIPFLLLAYYISDVVPISNN